MSTFPGVYNLLDCSTGHLSEEDNATLSTKAYPKELIVREHPYGYWIHVPTEHEDYTEHIANENIGQSIKDILKYAFQRECLWVNLDMDAILMDDLKSYEW